MKHESENPGMDKIKVMAQPGAASTTKKIMGNSLKAFGNMKGFDDAI